MPLNPHYSGVEQTIEISQVVDLQTNLNTLQSNLDAEASARASADTSNATATALVQSNLDAEASARASADTSNATATAQVQTNLDAEASTRLANDTTLQSNIDGKVSLTGNETIAGEKTLSDKLTINANTQITNSIASPAININHTNVGNYGLQMFTDSYGLNIYGTSGSTEYALLKVAGVGGDALIIEQGNIINTTLDAGSLALPNLPTSNPSNDKIWNNGGVISIGNEDILGNLQSNITTEITNRENADNTLQSNIDLKANQTDLDAEASTRLANDNTLQSNITTEIINRENADTSLQNNIDLKANQTDLDTESSTRLANDNTLQSNITTEIINRENADTSLQNNIDLKANQTDLDAEAATRASVDTALQGALFLKANQTDLDVEIATRLENDNILQSNIDTKQNLLNTSDLFLDTSVANQPKLGLGTNNPVSLAGSDTFLQIFGQVDCGLSLKRGAGGNFEFKVVNPTGDMTIYRNGSEKLTITSTETLVKQGLKVVGSVINFSNIPTSPSGLSTGDIYSNSGVLTIV